MAKLIKCSKYFEDFQIFQTIMKFYLGRLLSFKLTFKLGVPSNRDREMMTVGNYIKRF